MSSYRCAGCREYFRGPPHAKVGLSQVCSQACLAVAVRPSAPARRRPPDVPEHIREVVAERDRGRCRMCGSTSAPHAHHIAYRSEGGAHDERNLILLCAEHHALVHSDKRRWQPVLFDYIRAYYGSGRRLSLFKLDAARQGETPADEAQSPKQA